jgi:hypothetical protein
VLPHIVFMPALIQVFVAALHSIGAHHPLFQSTCTDHQIHNCVTIIETKRWHISIVPMR